MSKLGKALPPVIMAGAIAVAFGVMMFLTVWYSPDCRRDAGCAMMATLTLIAEIIGFVVLGLVFLLGLLTLGSAIHEFIRSRSVAYGRYWYDETGRWNRRRQNRQAPPAPNGQSDKPDAP
jgi:hypothetical protein